MTKEQFESRFAADPLVRKLALLHGKAATHPVEIFDTFQSLMEQERYVRARNRELFGLFCWRYWEDRFYGWSCARLRRKAGLEPR